MARLDDLLAYAGPVAFGIAAWAAAFRVGGVMRWLKADDGYREDDWC